MGELDAEPGREHPPVRAAEGDHGAGVGLREAGLEVADEGGEVGEGLLGGQIADVFRVILKYMCMYIFIIEKWMIYQSLTHCHHM